MLHGLGLARVEVDRLAQRILRYRIDMIELEHAAHLLQRHKFVAQRRAIELRQTVRQFQPLADGKARLAIVLEQAAEVDVGRVEIGVERDCLPQRMDGAETVAAALGDDRHVEQGRREMRILGVQRDPALVEFGGARRIAARLKGFGRAEELGYALDQDGSCSVISCCWR